MDDLFRTVVAVLIGGGILWRIVSGMLKAGGSSERREPPADDQYQEIRRRVEQRRRGMEDARQQADFEHPAPGESYADQRELAASAGAAADLPWGVVEPPTDDAQAEWPDPWDTPIVAARTDEAPDSAPVVSADTKSSAATFPGAGRHPRAGGVAGAALSRRNLRTALLAHEILQPPVSLRPPREEGG